MKRYIYTLFFGAMLSLTSCVMDDPFIDGGMPLPTPDGKSGLHIIGSVADFDNFTVGTRATGESYPDSYISEMTMFVFDSKNNLIQGYDANQVPTSSAINIPQSNPTFLIEAKKYDGTGIISSMGASLNIRYFKNKSEDLENCSIYIVANAYHQIKDLIDGNDANGEIKTLNQLKQVVLTIDDTLAMPKMEDGTVIGFPMIGHAVTADDKVATFNLKYSQGTTTNAVANIPLTKVYSKVCFTMQVVANQVVKDGPTPKFQLDKVEVFNVPSKAHLGYVGGDYVEKVCENNLTDDNIHNFYHYNSVNAEPADLKVPVQVIYHTSSTTITDSDVIKFEFYMPEHMVTPNPIKYPDNLPSNRQQYYKPKGVAAGSDGSGLPTNAKIATFVRIHGSYTDHNGRIKGVSYDIYLGQNEMNDFEVKRNQQLNNILTITGLTNHKDAYLGNEGQENISIDHRVTMTDRGYSVYMEREAILDAHFEVRPVDFELQNGSALTIVIPAECQTWVAMESDAVAQKVTDANKKNLYINNDEEKRGVRKYFTTNLVSELTNVASHTITMDDGRMITTNPTINGIVNKGTITLEHSSRLGGNNKDTEYFRVWFYVDENPNVYDETGTGKLSSDGDYTVGLNQYRLAPVKLYYTNTATDNPDIDAEAVHTINFQQWNLWRVWGGISKDRYYDIEHEEEYLNNYVSDDIYGQTQDGMPWGLEGIQLSDGVSAYWAERHRMGFGSTLEELIFGGLIDLLDSWFSVSSSASTAFANSGQKPYYDFYLSRDNFPTDKLESTANKTLYARDYSGLQFNKEIAETLKGMSNNSKAKIDGIILTEDPQSAFAYCYHKNKRNSSGVVETQKWFLPAIDEIEDIALGAYEEFDRAFQNKEYWSCQPAYNYNTLRINPNSGGRDLSKYVWFMGEFYSDNTKRARSTSVYATSATDYTTIDSGLPNDVVSGSLTATAYDSGSVSTSYSDKEINYNADIYTTGEYRGNSSRGESCRIRAVYRSGTK